MYRLVLFVSLFLQLTSTKINIMMYNIGRIKNHFMWQSYAFLAIYQKRVVCAKLLMNDGSKQASNNSLFIIKSLNPCRAQLLIVNT